MVGWTGFEPATPTPPALCATKLRHQPTLKKQELIYDFNSENARKVVSLKKVILSGQYRL